MANISAENAPSSAESAHNHVYFRRAPKLLTVDNLEQNIFLLQDVSSIGLDFNHVDRVKTAVVG